MSALDDYVTTLAVACATSGVGWGAVQGVLERKMRRARVAQQQAEECYRNKLHRVDGRLKNTRELVARVQAITHLIDSRCGDTFSHHTGMHHCLNDVGHLGVHNDAQLAWYGMVEFPLQVERKEAVAS